MQPWRVPFGRDPFCPDPALLVLLAVVGAARRGAASRRGFEQKANRGGRVEGRQPGSGSAALIAGPYVQPVRAMAGGRPAMSACIWSSVNL